MLTIGSRLCAGLQECLSPKTRPPHTLIAMIMVTMMMIMMVVGMMMLMLMLSVVIYQKNALYNNLTMVDF